MVVFETIEDRVRKPVQHCTSNVPVHDWKTFGMLRDDTDEVGCGFNEFFTQTESLVFIPTIRGLKFSSRNRSGYDWEFHARLRI